MIKEELKTFLSVLAKKRVEITLKDSRSVFLRVNKKTRFKIDLSLHSYSDEYAFCTAS